MATELTMIEIGAFKDLKHLISLLNETFEHVNYRLEEVPTRKGAYLFIEDPLLEDEYECGIIEKKGSKVYAVSPDVHQMILGAYERYLEKTGQDQ